MAEKRVSEAASSLHTQLDHTEQRLRRSQVDLERMRPLLNTSSEHALLTLCETILLATRELVEGVRAAIPARPASRH